MADRKVQTLSRSPTRLVETIYQHTHSVDFGEKKNCRLSNHQQSCVQHVATCIDSYIRIVWDESSRNIPAGILILLLLRQGLLPLILFNVIFFLSFFLINV